MDPPEERKEVSVIAKVAGAAVGVAAVAWGIYNIFSSDNTNNQNDRKTMKKPRSDGVMYRDDIERNPAGYFQNLRDNTKNQNDRKTMKKPGSDGVMYNPRNAINDNINDQLISWIAPCVGTIKINSDGSCFGRHSWGAFGGLARDDKGRWIEGFCGHIGHANPLQAELWGIRHAMELADGKNWIEAVIESDSLIAVNLINKEDVSNHPDRAIIEDCKRIKNKMLLEVIHIRREGNKCADHLAKLGRTIGKQVMRVMEPSDELSVLLEADMNGAVFVRGT